MKFGFLLAMCIMCAVVERAMARQPDDKEHARVRLVCETKTLTPGRTAWLGLHFEIDAQWHLYWNGLNDSGFAPKFTADFPSGFVAGETLWPAPRRLAQPGDILDHIYEKEVTLLIPVKVPKDAKPGTEVEFRGSVEWLVCHEVCLPGDAQVKLMVAVGTPEDDKLASPDAPHFAKARQRVPKPVPKEAPPFSVRRSEEHVFIQAKGATELAFYPALDCAPLVNPIKEGQRKGDRMTLTLKETGPHLKLKGVVEIKPQENGPPTLWAVEVGLESMNKSGPGTSDPESRPRGD